MHDTMITLQGYLGTEVECREVDDTVVASFRVAATPRRFHRRDRQWRDATTQWFGVTVWRSLAENCATSLHTGDPVVIHGRLTASTWTDQAGREVTGYDVEAIWVGHDLNRGTGVFTRSVRSETSNAAAVGGVGREDPAGPGSPGSLESGEPLESSEALATGAALRSVPGHGGRRGQRGRRGRGVA